jgi:hypothetical protein
MISAANEDYVRLPVTGEPAVDLASPVANEPPVGRQAVEPEPRREINRGSVRRTMPGRRVEPAREMPGAHSLQIIGKVIGPHTLSPPPANRAARLRVETR